MSEFDELAWDSEGFWRRVDAGMQPDSNDLDAASNRPWKIDPAAGCFRLVWDPDFTFLMDKEPDTSFMDFFEGQDE